MTAQAQNTWHFEKTVNFGHIFTTILLIASAFWFISDLEQATKANRQTILFMQERYEKDMARINAQRDEDIERVEKRLDKIEAKIDKLLSQSN